MQYLDHTMEEKMNSSVEMRNLAQTYMCIDKSIKVHVNGGKRNQFVGVNTSSYGDSFFAMPKTGIRNYNGVQLQTGHPVKQNAGTKMVWTLASENNAISAALKAKNVCPNGSSVAQRMPMKIIKCLRPEKQIDKCDSNDSVRMPAQSSSNVGQSFVNSAATSSTKTSANVVEHLRKVIVHPPQSRWLTKKSKTVTVREKKLIPIIIRGEDGKLNWHMSKCSTSNIAPQSGKSMNNLISSTNDGNLRRTTADKPAVPTRLNFDNNKTVSSQYLQNKGSQGSRVWYTMKKSTEDGKSIILLIPGEKPRGINSAVSERSLVVTADKPNADAHNAIATGTQSRLSRGEVSASALNRSVVSTTNVTSSTGQQSFCAIPSLPNTADAHSPTADKRFQEVKQNGRTVFVRLNVANTNVTSHTITSNRTSISSSQVVSRPTVTYPGTSDIQKNDVRLKNSCIERDPKPLRQPLSDNHKPVARDSTVQQQRRLNDLELDSNVQPRCSAPVSVLAYQSLIHSDQSSGSAPCVEAVENDLGLRIDAVYSLAASASSVNQNASEGIIEESVQHRLKMPVSEKSQSKVKVKMQLDSTTDRTKKPSCVCKLAFEEIARRKEAETYIMWHRRCSVRLTDISKALAGKSKVHARNRELLKFNKRRYRHSNWRQRKPRYDTVRPDETYVITCDDPLQLKVKMASPRYARCSRCVVRSSECDDDGESCLCSGCLEKRICCESSNTKIKLSGQFKAKLIDVLMTMKNSKDHRKCIKFTDRGKNIRYGWILSDLDVALHVDDADFLKRNFKLLAVNNGHFLLDKTHYARMCAEMVRIIKAYRNESSSESELKHDDGGASRDGATSSLVSLVNDLSSIMSQNDNRMSVGTTEKAPSVAVPNVQPAVNDAAITCNHGDTHVRNNHRQESSVTVKKEPSSDSDAISSDEVSRKREAENVVDSASSEKKIKHEPADDSDRIEKNFWPTCYACKNNVKPEPVDGGLSYESIKSEPGLNECSGNDAHVFQEFRGDCVTNGDVDNDDDEDTNLAGLDGIERISKLRELLNEKQRTLDELRKQCLNAN
ncbi:uncharacterized protein LOC141914998 [Tubulanus polymorphus]|uniref:uncharacterized protein LOC141914998 n=1 Tax=Tubulanus polymorphus TaxID=672921 RepID=UPI003DA68502